MSDNFKEIVKAWLDGATVEHRSIGGEWVEKDPYGISCDVGFSSFLEYRIKPRTIRIGEYDVPMPVSETPLYGQKYYVPSVTSEDRVSTREWIKHSIDLRLLLSGLIHLTPEAAEIHAKALISLTEVKP